MSYIRYFNDVYVPMTKDMSTPVPETGDFVAVSGDYSFGNKIA